MTLFSPKGYGFDEIYSNPQLSGGTIPTELTFTISQSPDKAIIGKNCFFQMRVSIIQTNETGNTAQNGPLSPIINTGTRALPTSISIPYLSQNPGICFFNNASCSVGTTMISQIQNLQQTNTLYRTLFESKTEQNYVYSQNSIQPLSLDDIDITVTPAGDTNDYNVYEYPAKLRLWVVEQV